MLICVHLYRWHTEEESSATTLGSETTLLRSPLFLDSLLNNFNV